MSRREYDVAIRKLYDLLTEAQLSRILVYSDGFEIIAGSPEIISTKFPFQAPVTENVILGDPTSGPDSKDIYIVAGLLFYSLNSRGVNPHYGVFSTKEFKSYIRERRINDIIE